MIDPSYHGAKSRDKNVKLLTQ